MKSGDFHFEEYIDNNTHVDLHPSFLQETLPQQMSELRPLILFGPSGVGKYTQALQLIRRYSPSDLKYEKKIVVTLPKQTLSMKVSDVHYEVDMSLLGCNSRSIWGELIQRIMDSIAVKPGRSGIVLCRQLHETHNELLMQLHAYLRSPFHQSIHMTFIFLTEQLACLPNNLRKECAVCCMARPSSEQYKQLGIGGEIEPHQISNIRLARSIANNPAWSLAILQPHESLSDKLLNHMKLLQETAVSRSAPLFLTIREIIYDMFIHNVAIEEVIWYIIQSLIKEGLMPTSKLTNVYMQLCFFLKCYNNNYRPIYHVERFVLYLVNELIMPLH